MFGNLIKGLFGSKSDRDVKKMMPLVGEINKLYEEYNSLTDEELKAKGLGFRERIKKEREELMEEHADLLEEEREALESKIADMSSAFASKKQIEDVGSEQIAELLDGQSALIEFVKFTFYDFFMEFLRRVTFR